LPIDVDDGEARIACNFPQLRRGAVYEFRPHLDRHRKERITSREDAAADAFACLQHRDVDTRVVQHASGLEPGDAGADDCCLYG
jgi:hypothetical protein